MSKDLKQAMGLAKRLTAATGYKNAKDWTLAVSGYTVALIPGKGVIASGLASIGLRDAQVMTINIALLTAVAPFLLGSGYELIIKGDETVRLKANSIKKKKRINLGKLRLFKTRTSEPSIKACGMKMDLTDLFTNILIVGSIGSGKTSAAIFPILEQLYELFAHEDNDITSKNPYKQIGGLYLDVKGEFYEGLVYVLDRAKRNFGKDLFIISPFPYIKVLKVRDVKTKNVLYLSAQKASKGGCISKVLSNPVDVTLGNINTDYIDDSNDFTKVNNELKGKLFNVSGLKIRYLTWREENGRLVRVKCQKEHNLPDYVETENGRETIEVPETVEYLDVIAQRRIHSFNIIDPRRKAIEVGKRLSILGELAQGEADGGKGKNRYFYDVAERALQKAITLLRIVYPTKEVEPVQVMHMVTKEDYTSDQIKVANEKIRDLENQQKHLENTDQTKGFEYRRVLEEKSMLQETIHYWSKTWAEEDQKQKGTFVNIIENMFSIFVMDANLQETFCKGRTYSFEDCCNKGRNYVFLPGEEYEESSRLIATALKLEFQDAMLNRLKASRMDKSRLVIFGNDEAQKNIVAGGVLGKGDEQFMSLSRAARVLNLIATQSYTSINLAIGNDKAAVYRQSFGIKIWFQNDDDFTNNEAARICGTIKRQKTSIDHDALSSANLTEGIIGGSRGKNKTPRAQLEKKQRHEAEDFINLKKLESITFNKGEEGTHDKVVKTKNKFSEVTNPDSVVLPELMRDYFQHSTELAILEADDFENYAPYSKKEGSQTPVVDDPLNSTVSDAEQTNLEDDTNLTNEPETYTNSRFGALGNATSLEVSASASSAEIIKKALNDTFKDISLTSKNTDAEVPCIPGEEESEEADNKTEFSGNDTDLAALVLQSEKQAAQKVESEQSKGDPKPNILQPSDVISANEHNAKEGLGRILNDMILDLEIERLPDVTTFINRTRSKVPDATNDDMVATQALPGPQGLVKGDLIKATDSAPKISQVDTKKILSNVKTAPIDSRTKDVLEKMQEPKDHSKEKESIELAQRITSTAESARRYTRKKRK